jgi:hypothetical protein
LIIVVVLVVVFTTLPAVSAPLSVPAELVIIDNDDASTSSQVPTHVFGAGLLVLLAAVGWAIYSTRRGRNR